MNTDNELNCVDLVRAIIRIKELCSIRATKDCKNCLFFESYDDYFCKLRTPCEWGTDSLNKWLKEHESEETK